MAFKFIPENDDSTWVQRFLSKETLIKSAFP